MEDQNTTSKEQIEKQILIRLQHISHEIELVDRDRRDAITLYRDAHKNITTWVLGAAAGLILLSLQDVPSFREMQSTMRFLTIMLAGFAAILQFLSEWFVRKLFDGADAEIREVLAGKIKQRDQLTDDLEKFMLESTNPKKPQKKQCEENDDEKKPDYPKIIESLELSAIIFLALSFALVLMHLLCSL